jgi:hypothetical protein
MLTLVELLIQLYEEDKIRFHEIFAHNLTISIRAIWSDPDIAEKLWRVSEEITFVKY